MNLRIFDSIEDLARAARRTILQRIDADTRVIGVSGGSTPKPLYELLAKDVINATFVLIDERYVPLDDPQSNTTMIRSILKPADFLAFDTSFEDPHESARDFERRWQNPQLDIAILGCGEDGHTASLFPGTPVLDVEDRVAAAVHVPRLDQWRVTLTMPVIRAAKLRLVLATGESKAAVIRDVAAGVDLPITRATTSPDGETWWLLDRAARP
jgi:6-phosphogluconolactonase